MLSTWLQSSVSKKEAVVSQEVTACAVIETGVWEAPSSKERVPDSPVPFLDSTQPATKQPTHTALHLLPEASRSMMSLLLRRG